jgi:hypothetical protein
MFKRQVVWIATPTNAGRSAGSRERSSIGGLFALPTTFINILLGRVIDLALLQAGLFNVLLERRAAAAEPRFHGVEQTLHA